MEESTSLFNLIASVKDRLQSHFPMPVWVVAEISEMNINRSGHCYLELIEKDALSDKILAKSRATIWAFAFRMIRPYFETSTGETLRSGLKVLVKASVELHEVYGFSLNISDIDPQYTIGDMAMKRARIIQQLEADGVLTMNKDLPFPLVPQRIAVVSSETAAGFGDFENQLQNNPYGFDFQLQLFPAIMQGDKASDSIIHAFEQVYNQMDQFDLLVLLRGGGSKSDLSCFDDYNLSYYITQFPMPVLTGIGHERDDSVCDMVAHTKLKTPTAVAEFLIQQLVDFQSHLDVLMQQMEDSYHQTFEELDYQLHDLTNQLHLASKQLITSKEYALDMVKLRLKGNAQQFLHDKLMQVDFMGEDFKRLAKNSLTHAMDKFDGRVSRFKKWTHQYIQTREEQLHFLEEKNNWANPQHILARGFAIVSSNGKVLKDTESVKKGDKLKIYLAKGKIIGTTDEVL